MEYFNADLALNEFLIGEIVAVYSYEQYMTNGMPDMKKIYPLYAGKQLFHYKNNVAQDEVIESN